jgi:hypothetical protein
MSSATPTVVPAVAESVALAAAVARAKSLASAMSLDSSDTIIDTAQLSDGKSMSGAASTRVKPHAEDAFAINVGGRLYVAARMTWLKEPHSYLATLLNNHYNSGDDVTGTGTGDGKADAKRPEIQKADVRRFQTTVYQGVPFVSRDKRLFRYIMSYLYGNYPDIMDASPRLQRQILVEAEFFGLQGLCEILLPPLPEGFDKPIRALAARFPSKTVWELITHFYPVLKVIDLPALVEQKNLDVTLDMLSRNMTFRQKFGEISAEAQAFLASNNQSLPWAGADLVSNKRLLMHVYKQILSPLSGPLGAQWLRDFQGAAIEYLTGGAIVLPPVVAVAAGVGAGAGAWLGPMPGAAAAAAAPAAAAPAVPVIVPTIVYPAAAAAAAAPAAAIPGQGQPATEVKRGAGLGVIDWSAFDAESKGDAKRYLPMEVKRRSRPLRAPFTVGGADQDDMDGSLGRGAGKRDVEMRRQQQETQAHLWNMPFLMPAARTEPAKRSRASCALRAGMVVMGFVKSSAGAVGNAWTMVKIMWRHA